MKFENTSVYNMLNAFRGMRNPMNSWEKADSVLANYVETDADNPVFGKNDMNLAKSLIKGGPEHRKFLRQIFLSVDITAPIYWWTEFDTYKVGTTANSCSTMHKITSRHLTIDDFELVHTIDTSHMNYSDILIFREHLRGLIDHINFYIDQYKLVDQTSPEGPRMKLIYLRLIKKLLPASYLQKRTVTMNYENILNIYHQRKNHRLPEWSVDFIGWAKTLPGFNELIDITKENN